MKFRYFKLTGKSLKAYLKSEKLEGKQLLAQHKALVIDRDDIESYRRSDDGGVFSIIFKKGMQPPGMVRASTRLTKDEVRPAKRGDEAKPFREFLESIKVTENCQETACRNLGLPTFAIGPGVNGRTCRFTSRIGHVGDDVFVEVPIDTDERRKFTSHADMVEIKQWEYMKAWEDAEESGNTPDGMEFTLKPRS